MKYSMFSFNKKYYLDCVKQLKMPGIIWLLLCLIITFLPISLDRGKYLHDIGQLTPVLEAYMFFGPITLVFQGFAYLFHRKGSDFFHALPLNRSALYTGMAFAVLTWALFTVVATCLFGYVTLALFSWPMVITHLPYIVLGYGLGTMLVTACAVIGVCAAGTRFSAFAVTGLVLFLPRLLSVLCAAIIKDRFIMLIPVHEGMLFNYTLNFPVSRVIDVFAGSVDSAMVFRWQAFLYTFIVAFVYFVLGGYLFYKRASEMAGNPAPTRLLQHVYRCLIVFPLYFALASSMVVAGGAIINNTKIVLFVTAIIIYCLYELITTKRFANLLPALGVLPIVIGVAFALVYGTLFFANAKQSILPKKGEITGIGNSYFSGTYYNTDMGFSPNSYEGLIAQEAFITNPEIIAIVEKAFENTVEIAGNGKGCPISGYYQKLSGVTGIHTKRNGVLYRNLYASKDEAMQLAKLMEKEPAMDAALRAMPDESEIYSIQMRNRLYEFDNELPRQIFDLLLQEYNSMTPVKQSQYKRSVHGNTTMDYTVDGIMPEETPPQGLGGLRWRKGDVWLNRGMIYVRGSRGLKSFYSNYPVGSMTPLAANAIMANANQNAMEFLDNILKSAMEENINDIRLTLGLYNVEIEGEPMYSEEANWFFNNNTEGYSGDIEKEIYMPLERIIRFINIVKEKGVDKAQINKPFACMELYVTQVDYLDASWQYENYGEIYKPLDSDLLNEILDMCKGGPGLMDSGAAA